jgi:hypothetical protein
VVGTAEFEVTDTVVYVYEPEYERKIGVLVFGSGLSSVFAGSSVRVFLPTQTPLAPTAFIPLNQPGVRGFLLPNGDLVTGDVKFEGRDGVKVTSFVGMGGTPILRIDIIGQADVDPEECKDVCPLIQEICFQRKAGSPVDVSQYGENVLALVGSCFDLEDICTAQTLRRLPDSNGTLPYRDDVCDDIPVPPVPCPDVDDEVCFVIAEIGPNLLITNPSSIDHVNPLAIKSLKQLGITDAPRLMQARPVADVTELADQIRLFTNPPFMADGLYIGIRGLSGFKRSRYVT